MKMELAGGKSCRAEVGGMIIREKKKRVFILLLYYMYCAELMLLMSSPCICRQWLVFGKTAPETDALQPAAFSFGVVFELQTQRSVLPYLVTHSPLDFCFGLLCRLPRQG